MGGGSSKDGDKIAYLGRDVEDAIQLKVIEQDMLPDESRSILGSNNSEIIHTLVEDIIVTSMEKNVIGFSDRIMEAVRIQRDFNYENIYRHPVLTGYQKYFERILKTLYSYLEDLFDSFGTDGEKYLEENNILSVRFGDYAGKMSRVFIFKRLEGFGNIVIWVYCRNDG